MAETPRVAPDSPADGAAAVSSRGVRLEVQGPARSVSYEVADTGFLIGSVPGCDLRLPGAGLPPVLCLIMPRKGRAGLRRLAPAHKVLVNGQPASVMALAEGDRVTVGDTELIVRVPAAAGEGENGPAERELQEVTRLLDLRQEQLERQARELENDQALWHRRRDELEAECGRLQGTVSGPPPEALAELARRTEEVEAARTELATLRKELYESYRQRRDRLAVHQEAVNHAAHKIQERKRQLDEDARQIAARQQEDAARRAELDGLAEELTLRHKALEARAEDVSRRSDQADDERRQLDGRRQELTERAEQCQIRERRLEEDRQALERKQAEVLARHQEDLSRLDRLQAVLDKREEQFRVRALDADRRHEQLHRDCRDLEEQGSQLQEWHEKIAGEAARVAEQTAEVEARRQEVSRRAAAVEEQQAGLAALRTRLERTREEVRQEESRLARQREIQEQADADLRRRLGEAQRLRADLERDQHDLVGSQRTWQDRVADVDKAVDELAQLQQLLDAEKERLSQQAEALEARTIQCERDEDRLRQQAAQLADVQRCLEADRQAVRDREAELTQAEQARETLQQQLQRRAEQLAERQRAVADQGRQRQDEQAGLEVRRSEVEGQRQKTAQELASYRRALEGKAAELKSKFLELTRREQVFRRHVEALKAAGRKVSAARKALVQERSRWQAEREEAADTVRQHHGRLVAAQDGVEGLRRQLPELELRARAAAEGLARAREQLRQHLAEIHAYARQSHHDLEGLRARTQEDAERLRRQADSLHHDRDDYRLAVAAFRQQLSEWQAQMAEMRSTLASDGTRLGWRRAEVEADSARLARQAQSLEAQEREVAQQRDDVDRHLNEMRQWYRQKLRELSQQRLEVAENGARDSETTTDRRDVLSLTGDLDPADRSLGELLVSLELVDPEALTALLLEAWKRRQSLREMLLAGGCVTLYQLSLIEAGNVDGLVLGPVRVVDRLRVTPREVAYRVFDPRVGWDTPEAFALLRHLAEGAMDDPGLAAEFRARFTATLAVRHANAAATREVLDVVGRPAVLLEWVAGLPPVEASGLAAVPGVWFRLVRQAALGLHAIHAAGLVHGDLRSESLLLTPDGVLKVCGYAEPPWLAADVDEARGETAADDLVALGQVAAAWAASAPRRKGAKVRPPVRAVQDVLDGLGANSGEPVYPDAAALLDDVDRLGAEQPTNPEAWDRLVRQVRLQAEDEGLRQSA